MKKTIRLTEGQLRRIIRKVLIEGTPWEDSISDVRQRSEEQREKRVKLGQELSFEDFQKTIRELWPQAKKKFVVGNRYTAYLGVIIRDKYTEFSIFYSPYEGNWEIECFNWKLFAGKGDTIHEALDVCKTKFEKLMELIPDESVLKNADSQAMGERRFLLPNKWFDFFVNSIKAIKPSAEIPPFDEFSKDSNRRGLNSNDFVFLLEDKYDCELSALFYHKEGIWDVDLSSGNFSQARAQGLTLSRAIEKVKQNIINLMEALLPY